MLRYSQTVVSGYFFAEKINCVLKKKWKKRVSFYFCVRGSGGCLNSRGEKIKLAPTA